MRRAFAVAAIVLVLALVALVAWDELSEDEEMCFAATSDLGMPTTTVEVPC